MTVSSEDDVLYEPERYELTVGPAYRFELARRDFLKTMGGGIFIVTTVRGVLRRMNPEAAVAVPAAENLPQRSGRGFHLRRRRSNGVHRKS